MITHSIIVKPTASRTYSSTDPRTQERMTQEELETFIKSKGVEINDFYINKHQGHLINLGNVTQVIDVEKDASKLSYWNSFKNSARAFRLMNFPNAGQGDPWVRWDDLMHYRKLTAEEIDQHIKPHSDHIQNLRKTVQS